MAETGLFIATLNFTPKFSDVKNMKPDYDDIYCWKEFSSNCGPELMPNQNRFGSLYFITILCVHANQRNFDSSDKW